MVRYKLGSSSSPTSTVNVVLAPPYPAITGVSWPSSPQTSGSSLRTNVSYRNDGGDGDVFIRLRSSAGAILASVIISVASGETGTVSLYFNMPSSDITYNAEIGSTSVTDTSASRTIEVLVTVSTSLTLSLSPTTVNPGDSVSFGGRLSRVDTVNPGVQTIRFYDDVSGTLISTVTTDVAGNYGGSFTAPSTEGMYVYASDFAGTGVLGASSAISKLRVGTAISLFTILPIAVGVIGIYFLTKFRG